MQIHDAFPYKVCVNLAARQDRRREVWGRFASAGLSVDRQPGVPVSWVRDTRGFMTPARYACSLAKRLAIRRAKLVGAPAVLLFEDDVVLAPDLHEQLEKIELPEDWGIFFLGCKHLERPEILAPGLVRVTRAADHHAMAVRREYFDEAIRGLSGHGKGSPIRIDYSDVKLSFIQDRVPTYAAYPNLAWQALSHSDNAGKRQTHYDARGRQLTDLHATAGLAEEMEIRTRQAAGPVDAGGEPDAGVSPGAEGGLPFEATRTDASSVAPPQNEDDRGIEGDAARPTAPARKESPDPDQSRDVPIRRTDEPPQYHYVHRGLPRHRLEETFPLRLYINLGRREDRRAEAEYQFALHGFDVERLPAIDGRRVTRTHGHGTPNKYACRLSHRLALRAARQRGAPAVLVFEDDVVPHPEFLRIVEALAPPGDWGVLFFGCTHVEAPEVVEPGWVRVKKVWGLQAYAVRAEWYETLLAALGAPGDPDQREAGADNAISELSDRIPMYATYPNIAWQDEGFSDLMEIHRQTFRRDGHQNRLLHVLRKTNAGMEELIRSCHGDDGLLARDHLLLRPGDVHLRAAVGRALWDFETMFPFRRYINLDDRVGRSERVEARLRHAGLATERFAAIEGVGRETRDGLPAGAYGCAMSHRAVLRLARRSGAAAALIFEDDVVLHRNALDWARAVALPDDWGILYLGCQHVETPIPVAPGLVRVVGAYSTHAYGVRGRYLRAVAAAIGRGSRIGVPCDVALAELSKSIPTYAFYPNLAWQDQGHSDVKQGMARSYGADGVQRWHRDCLVGADRAMRQQLTEPPAGP